MAKILVIDDEPGLRALLRAILEDNDHEVFETINGKKGKDICIEKNIDLVITDIFMPEKDGIETIMELRENFPDLKIIAMSGGTAQFGKELYLDMAKKLGAAAIIEKPVTIDEVEEKVNKVLQSP